MKKVNPLISIVMPAYNAEAYIEMAVNSMLIQSYENFELIVLNDGSTDKTLEILNTFDDNRIRIITNPINLGLIDTLNIGFNEANGKYIARMDSDDYSYNKRLELQVRYLEENPDVAMIGGGHTVMDTNGNRLSKQYFPLSFESIKAEAFFNSPFSHITVVIRKEILERFDLEYSLKYKGAEDYALWLELMGRAKVENLPFLFADYRINLTGQTSLLSKSLDERFMIISDIQQNALNRIGLRLDEGTRRLHYELSLTDRIRQMNVNFSIILDIERHFDEILLSNKRVRFCSNNQLKGSLGKIWIKVLALHYKRFGIKEVWRFVSNRLFWFGSFYFASLLIRYKVGILEVKKMKLK